MQRSCWRRPTSWPSRASVSRRRSTRTPGTWSYACRSTQALILKGSGRKWLHYVNVCVCVCVCVCVGVHTESGTEEAAAGPRCVLLHTHQGGNTLYTHTHVYIHIYTYIHNVYICIYMYIYVCICVSQLSVWMEGLHKQLSFDVSVCPDSVEALQALIGQQQQQQANTQVTR